MAAMDEVDLEMSEDPVLPTTELIMNGNREVTVDPSKLSLLASPENLSSPKLPFHGVGKSLRDVPTARPLFARNQSDSHAVDSSPGPDTEAMDITPSVSSTVQVRIPPAPRFPPLPYSSSRTGVVYDERMKFHAEYPELQSSVDYHPEDPRRISEIYEEIWQAGLIHGPNDPPEDAREDQCWWINTRPATSAEICLIHTPQHYNFIESLQRTFSFPSKMISD
jgi:histone deacetylase 6